MVSNEEYQQGGSGVVMLDAAGTAAWTAPVGQPGQHTLKIHVLVANATFSVLTGATGAHPFAVGTGVAGVQLPVGEYPMRVSAATISDGKALLYLS